MSCSIPPKAAAAQRLVDRPSGAGDPRAGPELARWECVCVLRIGPWVCERLLLFDLGYFRYQMFDCIDRNAGFFLT